MHQNILSGGPIANKETTLNLVSENKQNSREKQNAEANT